MLLLDRAQILLPGDPDPAGAVTARADAFAPDMDTGALGAELGGLGDLPYPLLEPRPIRLGGEASEERCRVAGLDERTERDPRLLDVIDPPRVWLPLQVEAQPLPIEHKSRFEVEIAWNGPLGSYGSKASES